MPELPEVETIRRGLDRFITKKKLLRTEILCDKSFQGTPVSGRVEALRRYGKALVIDLDNGYSLMIHLRMTGQLIFDSSGTPLMRGAENGAGERAGKETTPLTRYAAGHPSDNFTAALPNKQTRVILTFDAGTLYFNDQRKFGFIKVLPTSEVEHDPFISKLAPEPWAMTDDEFYRRLQRHPHSCIKAVILDQAVICGLGNIYADESLFASRIHPERQAGSITPAEAACLRASACVVMDRSIASGGSTMATYVKADGTKGDYLEKFAEVFHREGQPCRCCGAKIIKIRVAGRGTHLCPHCQPAPLLKSNAGAEGITENTAPHTAKSRTKRSHY